MAPIKGGPYNISAGSHQHAHSLAVNSLDNYLLYSHMFSIGYYTDLVLESWQSKVRL